MKNIQIPVDLFLDLCNYHLAGIRSPGQDQRIQQGLQDKLDAVKRRSDYHRQRNTHDKFPYGKPQTDEVARGSGTESMAVRD